MERGNNIFFFFWEIMMMILNDPVPQTLDMAKIKPPLIFLSKNLVSFF